MKITCSKLYENYRNTKTHTQIYLHVYTIYQYEYIQHLTATKLVMEIVS